MVTPAYTWKSGGLRFLTFEDGGVCWWEMWDDQKELAEIGQGTEAAASGEGTMKEEVAQWLALAYRSGKDRGFTLGMKAERHNIATRLGLVDGR